MEKGNSQMSCEHKFCLQFVYGKTNLIHAVRGHLVVSHSTRCFNKRAEYEFVEYRVISHHNILRYAHNPAW